MPIREQADLDCRDTDRADMLASAAVGGRPARNEEGRASQDGGSEHDPTGVLLDLLEKGDQDEERWRDAALPFGHIYDALMSSGCRAAAVVRKEYLGEEFGLLAGVPEEDRSGGRGNIGLVLTVSLMERSAGGGLLSRSPAVLPAYMLALRQTRLVRCGVTQLLT